MNRGIVSLSIKEFYDRLACAQVADEILMDSVVNNIQSYLLVLDEAYEPIDEYTLKEIAEIYSYHHFNSSYLTTSRSINESFILLRQIIKEHCDFLRENELLPGYLANWNIAIKVNGTSNA